MNRVLVCGLLLAAGIYAQPPVGASGGGRGGRGPAPLRSPQVMTDGTVTFRFRAPAAKSVSVVLEPGPTQAMTLGADGVWSTTVGPMQPDIYAYRFTVDGATTPDPSSGAVLKTARPNAAGELGLLGTWQSQFVMPGNPPEAWEMTDIPHGAVAHVNFYSKAMSAYRDYFVYTPPAFNPKRSKRYPVLYLLHGAGENASGWMDIGKVNLILDTLIAQGKAKEMIVVTPLGHPAQPLPAVTAPGAPEPVAAGGFGGRGASGGGRGGSGGRGGALNNNEVTVTPYFTSLLTEIIPQVEKNYNAGNTKATRALAGLSMGGGQTLSISLLHPELFNYVGLFSAAVPGGRGGATVLPAPLTTAWAKQFKLFWIACGSSDTTTGAANVAFKEALKEKGVPFTDIVTPGGHSYAVWKRNMIAFAPLLFQ